MNYVFDTSAILSYIKDDEIRSYIETTYSPFHPNNNAIISIVTIGEIKAVSRKNNWGEYRMSIIEKILSKFIVVEIKFGELLEIYADIEAFSQGKLKAKPSLFTARNMGKNDLWIAATAALTNSALLTLDRDYKHLDGMFFEVLLLTKP